MKNIKLNLTKKAINKFNELLKDNNNKIILYIDKKGCYGYSYNLKLINKNKKVEDLIKINFENIKVYIFKKDINVIKNLKIDYIKEDFNYKFIFTNINYKNFCKCGKSFNII